MSNYRKKKAENALWNVFLADLNIAFPAGSHLHSKLVNESVLNASKIPGKVYWESSFSEPEKFCEKLTFLTPSYAHVRVHIRG